MLKTASLYYRRGKYLTGCPLHLIGPQIDDLLVLHGLFFAPRNGGLSGKIYQIISPTLFTLVLTSRAKEEPRYQELLDCMKKESLSEGNWELHVVESIVDALNEDYVNALIEGP